MKRIYYSGILLLICLIVNGDYRKDCLVEDYKKIENWNGAEIAFYAYVLKNDTVNIRLTYALLDTAKFYTTIYFSPSINHSKIIETKDGKDDRFDLDPMKKENDWIQFRISSKTGSIVVKCEPDTHMIIPINQTKPTFKDMKIRASNISFCEERKWKVFEENHETIPLGGDLEHTLFTLKFSSSNDVEAYLHFLKYSLPLPLNEYKLIIERTNSSIQIEGSDIKMGAYENVTTIDIFSKGGNLNVSMSLGKKVTSLPSPTFEPVTKSKVEEKSCSSHTDISCLSTIIILSTVFLICTIIIGILFKFKFLKMKLPSTQNNKDLQMKGDVEMKDQTNKLISINGDNSDTKEIQG